MEMGRVRLEPYEACDQSVPFRVRAPVKTQMETLQAAIRDIEAKIATIKKESTTEGCPYDR